MMAMGAVGTISVTANVAPADVAGCVSQLDGDSAKAKELHYKMWELNHMMFCETNPIPAKAALAIMGRIALEYRLPLCAPSDANMRKLEEFAKEYGLIEEAVAK